MGEQGSQEFGRENGSARDISDYLGLPLTKKERGDGHSLRVVEVHITQFRRGGMDQADQFLDSEKRVIPCPQKQMLPSCVAYGVYFAGES